MQKRLFISLLLLCCITANAQYNFTKVDAWLAEHTPTMGGRAILMVYKDNKVIYSHAVNVMSPKQKFVYNFIAKREGQTANLSDYTPAMRQPIASCTKWYSAALVMTFVDEGKLKLTDTIGKFLPLMTRHGKGNITISECLSHTTGIDEGSTKQGLKQMRTAQSMDDAMRIAAELPMEGLPGKTFHYSNVGLQIAAAIIEKISGKDFETLFTERIAKPCQMTHTDYGTGKVPLAAGGAVSTPEDYLNFLVMIINKGTFNGRRVLSENSVAQMQINRKTSDVKTAYTPAEAGDFGYGFGEWVFSDQVVSSPGLFGSFPWVNKDKNYAAFMMTFYINNTGRHQRYLELIKLVDDAVSGK